MGQIMVSLGKCFIGAETEYFILLLESEVFYACRFNIIGWWCFESTGVPEKPGAAWVTNSGCFRLTSRRHISALPFFLTTPNHTNPHHFTMAAHRLEVLHGRCHIGIESHPFRGGRCFSRRHVEYWQCSSKKPLLSMRTPGRRLKNIARTGRDPEGGSGYPCSSSN